MVTDAGKLTLIIDHGNILPHTGDERPMRWAFAPKVQNQAIAPEIKAKWAEVKRNGTTQVKPMLLARGIGEQAIDRAYKRLNDMLSSRT